jgi:hypothetical protein
MPLLLVASWKRGGMEKIGVVKTDEKRREV